MSCHRNNITTSPTIDRWALDYNIPPKAGQVRHKPIVFWSKRCHVSSCDWLKPLERWQEISLGQINAQTNQNLQSCFRFQWSPPSKRKGISLLLCLVKHDQRKRKHIPFTLVQKYIDHGVIVCHFIIGCKVCCDLCNGNHLTLVFCLVIT